MRIEADIKAAVFDGNLVASSDVQSRFAIGCLAGVQRNLRVFNDQLIINLSIENKHACPCPVSPKYEMATPNTFNGIRDDQLIVFDGNSVIDIQLDISFGSHALPDF